MFDGIIVLNDPVNAVDPWGLAPGDPYATLDKAAMAAAADIGSMSNQRVEYGGWIYRQDEGTYSYTAPRTDNLKDSVSPGPRPCEAEADYHSHPRIPPYKYNRFSDSDMLSNDVMGLPGYLRIPNGSVLRYDPAPNGSSSGTVTRVR